MARNFNPSWDENMRLVQENGRDMAARLAIRENLHPQASEIVSHLMSDYPWLPAGVIASMAATGVNPSSPVVTAVARMAYQQKLQSGEWRQQGDRIVPKAPAPEIAPPMVEAQPTLPQPAPEPGSEQAIAASLNPTPEPVPPVEVPGAPQT